jgi:hypothetical protein
MNNAEKIKKLYEQAEIDTLAGKDKAVLEQMKEIYLQQSKSVPKTAEPSIGRIIMKSPITKLAAAAVIVITALVIFSQFSTSGVVWGAIVEKIDAVKSVVYHLTADVKMQGLTPEQISSKITGIAYYSVEYGTRSENYHNDKLAMIMYANPAENLYLTVIPESKKYIKVTNKTQEEIKQISDKDDPRVWVRRIMSAEYKKLGRSKINGINVEGIESTDPRVMAGMFEKATVRLWVEIGTDYPVRIEIDGTASGGQTQMSMVMDNIQWNVELDPALFVPEIPADYTSQEMTVSAQASEDEAIKALGLFAELTEGRYPSNLSVITLMKEVPEALVKKYGPEIKTKPEEYTLTLKDILSVVAFYTQLNTTSKDVAYYGDKVTAENPELVLMRWKVSDGVYRVIFADLSTGDVTPEELAELEASLPE